MRWLILIGLVTWVATCGQKGPLELPDASRATVTPIPSSVPAV